MNPPTVWEVRFPESPGEGIRTYPRTAAFWGVSLKTCRFRTLWALPPSFRDRPSLRRDRSRERAGLQLPGAPIPFREFPPESGREEVRPRRFSRQGHRPPEGIPQKTLSEMEKKDPEITLSSGKAPRGLPPSGRKFLVGQYPDIIIFDNFC